MQLSKTYIAGIATVAVVAAYGFIRRRGRSDDHGEQSTDDDWAPADD